MIEPQTTPTPSTGPDAEAALLPCPWCKQDDTGVIYDDEVSWTAWCDQFGCGFEVTEATREEAVVAWNRSSLTQTAPPMPLSATPPVDVEALIAKAEAAQVEDGETCRFYASTAAARDLIEAASPDVVLSLCEEIKRLRASSVSPAVDDGVLREALESVRKEAGHGSAQAYGALKRITALTEVALTKEQS